MLGAIKKRLGKIPLRYALLFTLANTFFLIYFGHIAIRVLFFVFCAILLYFFGKLPFADVDPVPLTTGIILLFFGFPVALQYAIWTVPAADAISARLNHFSFVNFISLVPALFATSISGFSPFFSLALLIVIFNILRFTINSFISPLSGAVISASTNTLISLIIASTFLPAIELGIAVFR